MAGSRGARSGGPKGRIRLYLDIDGVILKPISLPDGSEIQVFAADLPQFLQWAVEHFDCYWLTAWAPNGNPTRLKRKLLPHLPESAARIRIARWKRLKTEALRGRFLWVDDELLASEEQALRRRGWMDRLVRVNPLEPSLDVVRAEIVRRAEALYPARSRARR